MEPIRDKKVPMRMCVSCRQMRPKSTLLRIVHTPEGDLEIDFKGKKNGRGAYICDSEECILKAVKGRIFNRVFSVEVSQEIYDYIKDEYSKNRH